MYIYCITNTLNGKQYIGKCVKEVNKSKNYYGSGLQIKLAIKKYGKENFIKEIIEILEKSDKNFLCEREIYWIKEKNTKNPNGYNLTDGGDGAKGMTEETKEKIRIKNRLKVGKLNSRYGRKNSRQHNERLKEYNTGKILSEETKEKLKKINLGKKQTKESIEKTRLANIGRKFNEEVIQRIRINQPNAISVSQFDKNQNLIAVYISAAEAMRNTGVFSGSILNCCKGKAKTAGNYIWKFCEVIK